MEKVIFELKGFNCAGCIGKIENAITKLEGINSCKINFVTSTMKVEGENLNCQEIKKIFSKYEPNVIVEMDEDCSCGSSH